MGEVRNIDSAPDPRRKAGEKDAVDPDKFQKALKVEKADETDKREKRNRPKKQEELEDEQDDVGASIPVPHGLFKEYMSEDEKKASALDAQDGTSVRFVSDGKGSSSKGVGFVPDIQEGSSTPSIKIEVGEGTSSAESALEDSESGPATTNLGSEEETPSTLSSDQNTPTTPTYSSTPDIPDEGYAEEIDIPDTVNVENVDPDGTQTGTDQTQKKQQKEETKTSQTVEKKDTKETSKKGASTESKESASKKGVNVTSTAKDQIKESAKKAALQEGGEKTSSAKEETGKAASLAKNVKTSTEGKVEEKKAEKAASKDKDVTPISAPKEISEQKSDHKDGEQKSGEEVVAAPTAAISPSSGIAALQMSPFANIPKDVFTLFEKMVGMMQVSKDNGKSITTVKLNMPHSVFDECELVLEHYDTAPNNYTVQFLGNPQAVERFAKNLPALNNAIAESKLTFSIHFPPPRLSKTYSSSISGLEKEKGDKDEENDREENRR